MKLQIMSDLHFEMHADRGAEFIRDLDSTGVDVLVLAGDIVMARDYEDLESVFQPLARKYRKILYVPGNHEYYRSSPQQVTRNLAKLTNDIPAVVMPDNGAVVIAGQRFVAGTMWFRPDPMGGLGKPQKSSRFARAQTVVSLLSHGSAFVGSSRSETA